MDGSNDFRPEADDRVPDPSWGTMLRRARDAQLGNDLGTPATQSPGSRLLPAGWPSPVQREALERVALLVLGIVIGVLGSQLISTASSSPPAAGPASQATISVPTLAPPTPTAIPVPLTAHQIGRLARVYYDTQGPAVGRLVMMDGPTVQIQSVADRQVTACVGYAYAASDDPAVAVGTNTRTFTLSLTSEGSWQVVQMSDAGSCATN